MTRYTCSQHLEIESRRQDGMVLVHRLLGSRLRVSPATHHFLQQFKEPCELESLGSPEQIEKARPTFEQLCRAGFLVRAGHTETFSDKVLQRISPGFFGSPAAVAGEEPADAVFVGVPFDYGNHKDPGARFGPSVVRQLSTSRNLFYVLNGETGRPEGWFDNRLERRILQDVTLADAGNLFVAPNENPQQVFSKLQTVVGDLLARGSFPVVIGGDHSITYPIVAAYEKPLVILQIDAHSDLAPYYPSVENHHGNVMSRALSLDHVQGIYQLGVRGTTQVPQTKVQRGIEAVLSPRRMRSLGIQGVIDLLPKDVDYYVSFDIDALDPIYAPGTSTPVPGGLTFDEAQDLLTAVGEQRRCVGFDLVEVNPRKDPTELTASSALELILTFLGAHTANRGDDHV